MHADLTRLINERSNEPFFLLMTRITLKGYKMASKKTWEQIPEWVEPISERILNIASQEEVSENQLSLKSNNTNESESGE